MPIRPHDQPDVEPHAVAGHEASRGITFKALPEPDPHSGTDGEHAEDDQDDAKTRRLVMGSVTVDASA